MRRLEHPPTETRGGPLDVQEISRGHHRAAAGGSRPGIGRVRSEGCGRTEPAIGGPRALHGHPQDVRLRTALWGA